MKGKTGSLTGLPIIETQAGDVTAFVPTNVISITDGQIFLEDRPVQRRHPARHERRSLRVARRRRRADQADHQEAGRRHPLALAQYRELAAFSQFASDLDEATRKQLERGQRVTELMKQKQYAPMSVAEMALSLYAVNNGYMDKVELQEDRRVRGRAAGVFAKTNYKASAEDAHQRQAGPERGSEATLKKISEEFADRDVLKPWPAQGNPGEDRERQEHAEDHQGHGNGRRVKMRKAQDRMRAARPYAEKIRSVIGHLRRPTRTTASVPGGSARPEACRLHRHQHGSRPVRRR